MIVLDRDVLAKISGRDVDQGVLNHCRQYSREEWTIPAIVAWESYKAVSERSQKRRVQRALADNFDRILDLTDDAGLEAAALDESLSAQGVTLDTADLLNLAIAHEAGGTFVTHNANDFDTPPVHDLVDIDVVTGDST
ncbi:type II toxin-antitoxin system VapC family toxin [Halococcoides cellulosivorans]|uniref:PIN domain nuclease n=1 Tax=Halococcoides cellulosivorans TaxID=1679096 RepID=A0A2R4X2M8_9EURY|nr:type II toxin-antitoxin system VapC family toxin [Halococcoides cellulosivorans]AWB28057.1 PIN domain nuclease [Halococcoides cellulosivorans]